MAKGGGGGGTGQFLAVAYTDVNGNHKFDAKDTLIAGLIDTNKDHTVSLGDTVTFGTYPHLSGKEAGTYLSNDSIVTSVGTPTSEGVVVGVADGQVGWFHVPTAEVLFTATNSGLESQFQDDFTTTGGGDFVFADSNVNGPGDPETGLANDTVLRSGDQPFIDVDLFFT